MKRLKFLTTILVGLLVFAACQKELSFENPLPDVFAEGSLQSSAGNCAPIVVNGVFKQDSVLGEGNFVDVQVRITAPGKYVIYTDTQNGFSFRDSSYVTDTGVHTFSLKATGTPVQTQNTDFIVAFDSSICLFSVPVIGNTLAQFTLEGSPDACSNYQVAGDYEEGEALTAANRVNLQVNVTAPGSYTVNTGNNGGMTFSASGNFTNVGLQTIILQGTGTASAAGTYTIPIIAGSSSCSFDVVVVPAGSTTDPNFSDSAWEFTQGTNSYNGPFFRVFDTTQAGVGYGLIFLGYTPTTADTVLQMGIVFSGGDIQPGTYNTNTFAAFQFNDFSDPDTANVKNIYRADFTTTGVNTGITISSYDQTTGIIEGTFTGTAFNASNTSVPITGGKFRARVE